MKKWIYILVFTVLCGSSILFLKLSYRKESAVVINEVCSRNGTIFLEDNHTGDDYIELYNTTNRTISLEGWYLSDDPEEIDKYRLPAVRLEPHGYAVFYANGKETDLHSLNFKIDSNGEQIFLADGSGKVMDQIYVPSLEMDQVYGRIQDGTKEWQILEATPGKSNDSAERAIQKTLHDPVFSHESGYYEEEFTLTLSVQKGQQIYYTTDGSIPTRDSIRYEDGIRIHDQSNQENVINGVQNIVADWKDYQVTSDKADKIMVIRAVAMDEDNHTSKVVTKSYIVGLEKYKDANILSITANPDKLIGSNGILVTGEAYDEWYLSDAMSTDGVYEQGWTQNYELANFWKSGRDYEILGNAQFFKHGEEYINQEVGIRTQGNITRMNEKKSIQLFSRKSYSGSFTFSEKVFEDSASHAVYVSSIPEKAYCMKLMEGRNVGLQGTESYELFLNGEYWYTAVLMEKYDETYFSEHFSVETGNILYEKDRLGAIGEENAYLYDDLVDYLRDETISQEEKAVIMYEQMDAQSFIDWMCFNLYVCNNDVSYKKNSALWRTIELEDSAYGDCKWRWLLYDIDHAATYVGPESSSFDDFSIAVGNRFYDAFKASPEFCQQFVLTAMDLINTNFSLKNVEKVLGEWGLDLSYANSFFVKRPEYMIESLRKEFALSGTVENVTLSINDAEAGRIMINTAEADMTEENWCGQYFTDFPVTVTAVANPGYRFVKWIGDQMSEETTMKIAVTEGGVSLKAVFEKE